MAGEKRKKNVGAAPPAGAADKAPTHDPTVRKGYEAARHPEPQGDGDPGTDEISEEPPKE